MTTKTWIGGNGDWNTPSDWNPAGVPGPGDDAIIQNGEVSLTTPITVGSISVAQATRTTGLGVLSIADPGGTETVTGNFDNDGTTNIDTASSGSTLTIGGTLTITGGFFHGSFNIGYSGLTADSTVTAANLSDSGIIPSSNSGVITLTGGNSATAILDITGAAPATWTGSVFLLNSALLEFGSGGITTIANGATLSIQSGQGHVALAGDTGTNSALTQLSSNAGTLLLEGGTTVTTDAGTNFLNSGFATLSASTLTVGGTLINSGGITVNAGTLSAASFSNSGSLDIHSDNAGHASATFGGVAPSTINGNIRLSGDASMQFTGGGTINSIPSGATLELDSFQGSSPLLAGISGLTNNAGTLGFDTIQSPHGGLNLTFNNTITNTGTINYGAALVVPSGPDTVTMAGLNNTGSLVMNGASFASIVTLNVLGPAPSTLTGDNYIGSKRFCNTAAAQSARSVRARCST